MGVFLTELGGAAANPSAITGSIASTQIAYGTGVNTIGGNASLVRDATTGGIVFGAQPIVFGISDTVWDSEPALVIKPSSGNETSLILASVYTDPDHWSGLFVNTYISGGAQYVNMGPKVDGASSTSGLAITAGSGGVGISTGLITLYGSDGISVLGGNVKLDDGLAIQGNTTTAHTWKLGVYDVNASAYRYPVVFTNGDAPDLTISIPTTGTTNITASMVRIAADVSGAASTTTLTNAVDTTLTNVLVVKGAAAGATPNVGMLKVYVGTTAYGVPYFPLA